MNIILGDLRAERISFDSISLGATPSATISLQEKDNPDCSTRSPVMCFHHCACCSHTGPSAGTNSNVLFTWAAAFSPNMESPPTYVDSPLDSNSDVIDPVLARWQPNNPTWLAAQLPAGRSPSPYIDCGTGHKTAFAESLSSPGWISLGQVGDHE